jgi:transglutaminase-like putative cysteine protease
MSEPSAARRCRPFREFLVWSLATLTAFGPVPCALAATTGAGAPQAVLPSRDELAQFAAAKLAPAQPAVPAPADLRAQIDAAVKAVQPIEYRPELRAAELGAGVEPCFNYVRDHIRYESYPGVMRGAKGAYVNRAANAADRALLLAAMLKTKGIATRFAIGQLNPERSAALLERMFQPVAAAPAAAAAASAPGPAADRGADLLARVRARATRDLAAVKAALGDALPASAAMPREQLLAEIAASHVWVQAKVGEQWTDLDPSLPDARPGATLCEARQTVEALPAEFHQVLTIRLIAERLDGAKLAEETLVETTRPVVNLVEREIGVLHAAQEGVKGIGNALASGGGRKFLPILLVDGEMTVGNPLAFPDDSPAVAGAAPAAGGSGFGGFADVFDTPKPAGASAPTGPQLVAEFLEFELTRPGGRKEVTRRTLFDRGGPAWRAGAARDAAALRPLERDDAGPVDAATIYNVWLSTGRHDMAGYAESLATLFTWGQAGAAAAAPKEWADTITAPPDLPPEGALALALHPIAMGNFGALVIADEAFVPALNGDPDVRMYLDSPRIALFSSAVVQSRGQAEVRTTIDWRRDVLRGVAKDPAKQGGAVAERKIWFGLLEGALEHEWAAGQMTGRVTMLESTSAALNEQGAVRVASPSDAASALPGLKPDAAAEAAAALAAGDVLVVPRGAIGADAAGWWAISGATADTRAVWTPGHALRGGNLPPRPPGGSPGGPSVNVVNPKNLNGGKLGTRSGGGGVLGEEMTLLTIHIGDAYVWVITGKQVAAVAIAAAVALAVWTAAN